MRTNVSNVKKNAVQAVITTLDDVIYPEADYHKSACRAGAGFIKRLFNIDIFHELTANYSAENEENAVRATLLKFFDEVAPHIVRTTTLGMNTHLPEITPYEDALESFNLLNGFNIKLGMLCAGPALIQRNKITALNLHKIFNHTLLLQELVTTDPWLDAINLLELLLDCPVNHSVFITASRQLADEMSNKIDFSRIYLLNRSGKEKDLLALSANITTIQHLFELPERMGLVIDTSDVDCSTDSRLTTKETDCTDSAE